MKKLKTGVESRGLLQPEVTSPLRNEERPDPGFSRVRGFHDREQKPEVPAGQDPGGRSTDRPTLITCSTR